jgi:DNA (cytosine-5)-methyltransferase 1
LLADLTGLGGSAGGRTLREALGKDAGEFDEVKQARKFVDLFSGCGGLSLGLSLAGMRGLFAIERDDMAFETFSTNFIGDDSPEAYRFMWPSWLFICCSRQQSCVDSQSKCDTGYVRSRHGNELQPPQP